MWSCAHASCVMQVTCPLIAGSPTETWVVRGSCCGGILDDLFMVDSQSEVCDGRCVLCPGRRVYLDRLVSFDLKTERDRTG